MDKNEKDIGKEGRKSNQANKKDSKFYIYCLTSFHSDIYKDDTFSLISKNSEIESVSILSKSPLQMYKNYDFIIYEMAFSKKIKKLNLALLCKKNNESYNLNEIKITSEKEKVILLDDILVNQETIFDFLTQLDPKFLGKNVFIMKYLNSGEKLNLFLNCFDKLENKDELRILLAKQVLAGLKEGTEILFSELILIFNIAFGTKIITNFLDKYPKLDIQFDIANENEEFNKNILNLYKSNINQFFEKNINFFQKNQTDKNNKTKDNKDGVEKYKDLLEEFMILYQLIYDDQHKLEKQKLIKVKNIFFNLIENKNDLIKSLKFLVYKFDAAFTLINTDFTKRYSPKPIINHLPHLIFEQFAEYYEMIIREENNKNKYVFDFSECFTFFVDHFKNIDQLISLKKLYQTELAIIPNDYFTDKIRLLIHTIGINSIKIGSKNNMQIIEFLKNDDIYTKKEFNFDDTKDFEILKYLKIESMNKEFFDKYNEYGIYTFFEEYYLKFLSMFSSIKEVKYFGIFFKLLPPEKYEKETAFFLYKWLSKNINTYDEQECPNFENQIEIFYNILNEKYKEFLIELIKMLKNNLGNDGIRIFIYLINKCGQTFTKEESEIFVNYIIFEQPDNEEVKQINLNNLYKFVDEANANKLMKKIFLNEIENIAITKEDFFSEYNFRFNLFNKLLEKSEYSLLGKTDNKNYQYWLNTKRTCNSIYEDMKNLNYIFDDIKVYFNGPDEKIVKKKITSICKCLSIEDYENVAKSIHLKISDLIEKWQKKIKVIENIRAFYTFAYEKNKLTDEFSEYTWKINRSTLQYLASKEGTEEFNKFTKDKETAEQITELRQHQIFLNIFNDTKRRYNLKNYIDEGINRFNKLKNVFVNDKTKMESELKNSEEAKFLINIGYKNEHVLGEEIDWLIKHFKFENFDSKSMLIDGIKAIIKKKSIFSIISGILELFDICKDQLNLSNQEDKALYDQMTNYKNILSSNKDISIDEIQNIDLYIENKFDVNDKSRKIFLQLLIAIDQYPESIKFIKDKKAEQVSNLVQFLLESDNTPLNESDINDFITVVKLFGDIISILKGQFDVFTKFLCSIVSQIVEETKTRNSLFNYIEKYHHIQALFNDYLKHSEGCIKKIEKILEDSNFTISKDDVGANFESNSYSIQGTFNDQTKDYKIKNIELSEGDEISKFKTKKYQPIFYHDLEFLFQRVYISKVPQQYEECAEIYINFFKSTKKLINLFNAFYSKGFQEKFEVNIDFKENQISCLYKKQKNDLNSLIYSFDVLNMQLDEILNKIYCAYEVMRFFYGRQISFIYTNMINGKVCKILDLLRASFGSIFGDCVLDSVNLSLKEKNIVKKYYENITIIRNYIERQFSFNKKNINNIFETNKIILDERNNENNLDIEQNNQNANQNQNQNVNQIVNQNINQNVEQNNIQNENQNEQINLKNKYSGIFYHLSSKNQELEILNLYVKMTNNFPINGSFLYCSKDLTLEELKCFLLRFRYCKNYILFSMVNINLLTNELREYFISFLKRYMNKLEKNEKKIKCCLVLVFNSNDDELQKILSKIKSIKEFPEPSFFDFQFNFSDYFPYNDSVVKSASCGLGKTEFVKNKNEPVGKKKQVIHYIYFPIGGKFNRKNLVDRLKNLPDMTNLKEIYAFHIDLSQTKEIELLNEFFFKLIILRKCDINEAAIYFGSNINITIEVPNDFSDYIKDIEILSKLKTDNLTSISNINPSNELLNVAKILNMYENDDILKKQKNDLKKVNLKLTQEQIGNMVLEYLKKIQIDNPNYYQINIFIKVLSDEFVKFYSSKGYSFESLVNNAIASGLGKENAKKLLYLRKFIINSLVQVTKLFLVGPYESLLKNQEINKKLMNETDENKEKAINKELTININSVSFDEIKPSLIVFNEDGESCTIITTCSEQDSEFQDLQNLYNLQDPEYLANINKGKSKSDKNVQAQVKTNPVSKLKRFRELSRNEILDNVFNFLNLNDLSEIEKKRILGNYVYTPDNFIKVVLILLRIRVNIPVILMGETGCGKTTLIEMASKLIHRGKINSLHKMNIHAGITDEDIVKFMKTVKENVDAEDKRMIKQKKNEFESQNEKIKKTYLKRNSMDKIYLGYERQVKNRKIWIFFDEINTCNSMGLFIEIMCKNSIYGKPLDDRFVFVAACNPYRVSQKENMLLNVLYKKNHKKKNLVYTVNPLPMSLLNFVFNFGSLKEKDEFIYIQSMVEGVTSDLFEQIKDPDLLKEKFNFIKMETECVQLCQNYMKKNNDVSIVSLREVNRFNVFVKFFFEYLLKRKKTENIIEENEIIDFYQQKNELEILFCAVNLSLFTCYYLRIPDRESRQELVNHINEKKIFSEGDFLKIPDMEQNYLLDNLEIPVGIAKNQNLKENTFLIFFCIINKIPVIICGKPGKSKTLSFEIVQESLKGKASKFAFCRKYPPLIPFKIQGSLNTTSEEILNVFNKGRKFQMKNSEKGNEKLAVVFMDEMGLAEISENNPLKVMHAELEQETDKIAFVGISNWFIDASKMNRVIYNVAQDSDEADLIHTGEEIARSYEKIEENFNSDKYEYLISRLSKAYYKFITEKKDKNQYFHGSRDFYSLIKSIMHDIIKNKEVIYDYDIKGNDEETKKLLNEICINQISRNFGGLEESVYKFKKYYLEGYESMKYSQKDNLNYDFMKCIQDNIIDMESRYLLLINDGHLCQELLNFILEDINENRKKMNTIVKNKENKEKGIELFEGQNTEKKEIFVKYYIGSKFKSDKKNVVYSNEILNKVKIQMETENILILKDLESVYPALYELFNQNYIYLNGKKFVHLGESKSLSLVNNKFKVIVLVDKDQVENQEPPFLNRFEKHIINFSSLLKNELEELADEIYNNMKEISNIINNENTVKNNEFVEKRIKKYEEYIKKEEIQGLVYMGSKQLNYSYTANEETKKTYKPLIIKFVIERICPCFPEELMTLITKFGFKQKYNFYYKLMYQCYKEKYCYNLDDYLTKLNHEISIVFTFSSMYDEINISNTKYPKTSIAEMNMNNINSIEEINKKILDFMFVDSNNENKDDIDTKDLLIIKFKEEDMYKLDNIYYLIDDYKTNPRNKNINRGRKKIVLIVYIKKINKIKNYISFISNCPQIVINNLNNEYQNFPEILINSNKNIIKKGLFDIDSMISKNINESLRYFNYKIFNYDEKKINSYKDTVTKRITESKFMRYVIKECFANLANNEEDFLTTICKEDIPNKTNIEQTDCYNFATLVENKINDLIYKNLRIIIIILEKEQIMSAIISNERLCTVDLIKKYIKEFAEIINNEQNKKYKWKNKNLNQKADISFLHDQKLPFCQNVFNYLFNFVEKNIATKFIEKDTYFITTSIKDQNIRNEIEEYMKFMQKMDDNLKFEIFKDKKNKIVYDILNSNNEELISNLFEDCFFAFIKKDDKLKKNYTNLSQILNLLIQLRLKTRINNELSLLFIEKEEIKIYNSFLDLIKEEYIPENKDQKEKEEIIYLNEMKVNKTSIYFNVFISVVNFLQSYSKEIYIILELYNFLLENIPSIYEEVVLMISKKKISMEETKRNSYYNKINKFSFFYILESLCKILNEKIYNILEEKKDANATLDFFKSVEFLVPKVLQLEKRFLLFSKEIFSLDITTKIISQVQLKYKNKSFVYLTIETLKIFLEKTDKNTLISNLQGKNIILMKLFGENVNEYSQLMNKILLNSYKSEFDVNLREKIIKEIVLESKLKFHKELIEFSFPLLKLIFKFISSELPSKKEQKPKFIDNFNEENPIKKSINDKNDAKINDILFYRFEILCQKYFEKIKKETETEKDSVQKLCGDLSKLYLKDATDCFYMQTHMGNIYLNNVYKMYCMAYIKVYLNYYVDALFDGKNYNEFTDAEDVGEILFASEEPQRKVIQYYLLKLISKKCKSWDEFATYYNSKEKNDIFGFKTYGKLIRIEQSDNYIKSPFLLHCNKIRENNEYTNYATKLESTGFDRDILENLFIAPKKYDNLYIFLTNVSILFNSYSYNNNIDNIKKRNILNNLIRSTISYLNEEKKLKDKDILLFINTFFDPKNLEEKIYPKILLTPEQNEEMKLNKLIILYYSLLFVIFTIVSQKNKTKGDHYYYNLISKNIASFLDSNYIPGNFQFSNLRVRSFYQIKDAVKKDPIKYGAYICSCGYHYLIGGCTLPRKTFNCPICHKKIGGEKNHLIEREGHLRIFLDEESRAARLTKRNVHVPNILLSEFENEINEKKREMLKGIKTNELKLEDFELNDENVRDMKDITYRFLNFVLYSFIFYGNIMGFIKDKNMNTYNIENLSCFQIMEKDWEIMQKILEKISVEHFINIIFDDVIEKIISCTKLSTKEDAIKFEAEINNIIISKITDKKLVSNIKKINDDSINASILSSKSIIQEVFPYDRYPEKDFPDFKYFYILDFPSKEHFIKTFNSKEKNKGKYPILNSIINNEDIYWQIELMQYLPKINKLCNYMINYVSFKYSREEAKNILIKDSISDEDFQNLLQEFIPIYKKIRPHIKQEGCHEFGELYLEINEKSVSLSDLCVDSGEMGFGLVLLAMYKEMSSWQNSFINEVLNSDNIQLKNYKDLFSSKIMIQDCDSEQILNLPRFDSEIILRNDKNVTLFEMIVDNSYRKESEVIYNYDEIEEELASYILPKIKSFKLEFRKVVYQFECFIGDRSSLIVNFLEKYQTRDLTENELNAVVSYITKNQKTFDMKNFLFSLQVLIDIILDESPNMNESLNSIIEKKENIPFIDLVKSFFKGVLDNVTLYESLEENTNKEKNNNFSVNCLINLLELVERFCWENIRKNLDKKYFEDITEEIKMQFDSSFNPKQDDKNDDLAITKLELCSAIRKFLSRYLSGKSEENINPKNLLKSYLVKDELWPKFIADIDLEEEINTIFGNVEVFISNSVKLFDYLGGDEEKLEEIKEKYKIFAERIKKKKLMAELKKEEEEKKEKRKEKEKKEYSKKESKDRSSIDNIDIDDIGIGSDDEDLSKDSEDNNEEEEGEKNEEITY